MRNVRIGDYLVEQGLITQEQLEKVLAAQKESNGTKRFGTVVVELGFMTETNLAKALAGKVERHSCLYYSRNGEIMAELENHMVLGIGFFDEEAARRRLEREEYEMEHADDAWDDWLGGEPIENETEADVSASVPDLR